MFFCCVSVTVLKGSVLIAFWVQLLETVFALWVYIRGLANSERCRYVNLCKEKNYEISNTIFIMVKTKKKTQNSSQISDVRGACRHCGGGAELKDRM